MALISEFQSEATQYVERHESVAKTAKEIDRLRDELSRAERSLGIAKENLSKRVGPNIQQKACVVGSKILVVRYVANDRPAEVYVMPNDGS